MDSKGPNTELEALAPRVSGLLAGELAGLQKAGAATRMSIGKSK